MTLEVNSKSYGSTHTSDLNSPSSSPSGHFHGMPVRCLLAQSGEFPEALDALLFSKIKPEQIVYVGVRDMDE